MSIKVVSNLPPPPPRNAQTHDDNGLFKHIWSGWFSKVQQTVNGNLQAGLTVVITTAKLTAGGTNGSMTFTNGILTAQTAAT